MQPNVDDVRMVRAVEHQLHRARRDQAPLALLIHSYSLFSQLTCLRTLNKSENDDVVIADRLGRWWSGREYGEGPMPAKSCIINHRMRGPSPHPGPDEPAIPLTVLTAAVGLRQSD